MFFANVPLIVKQETNKMIQQFKVKIKQMISYNFWKKKKRQLGLMIDNHQNKDNSSQKLYSYK